MSHLTTIIGRVKRRLALYEGELNRAKDDPIFIQSVRNLNEYPGAFEDYTEEELKEAKELYEKYRSVL